MYIYNDIQYKCKIPSGSRAKPKAAHGHLCIYRIYLEIPFKGKSQNGKSKSLDLSFFDLRFWGSPNFDFPTM